MVNIFADDDMYDRITDTSVDKIWKVIEKTRKNFKLNKSIEENFELDFVNFEFELTLVISRCNVNNPEGFNLDAASDADNNWISILIEIDPDMEPLCYNELNLELQDDIRHEIEHLTHDGINKVLDSPNPKEFSKLRKKLQKEADKGNHTNSHMYYTLGDEMGPDIQGMYRKSKLSKKPMGVIINNELDKLENKGFIDKTNREIIYKKWIEYSKQLLPHAKFDY